MICQELTIYSQNIRKNKILTDIILEARKANTNLVCTRDRCGKMALINHVPKHSHTLSFHSKIQINSGKIQINWVKLE